MDNYFVYLTYFPNTIPGEAGSPAASQKRIVWELLVREIYKPDALSRHPTNGVKTL